MAKSDGATYFQRSSLFWIVAVTLGVGYFTCVVFAPEKIPFEYLGVFGSFCKHLVDNYADVLYKGWWATWAIHLFEACIALRVCSHKGISNGTTRFMWFFQTFLFGFASLSLLLKYDPERPKQH
ncbi:transmembrane protein 254 [Stegastes partitus]|uniref:Transmembrane protein 254 n=1 Tax=Stegastes partitus TaxID=144197 RepID=A0A3B5BHE0_9TELE|nr:PREDICTED: transmembrane protein 254 [Stegastes partitus]